MFKRIIIVRGNSNSQSADQESHPSHVKVGSFELFDLFFFFFFKRGESFTEGIMLYAK